MLYHPKDKYNWGTVVRSAYNFEADFIATVGSRLPKQASNTCKTERHIPVFHFVDWNSMRSGLPVECVPVAIEVDGTLMLESFCHPERAAYIFGAEDGTLPEMDGWSKRVKIATNRCLNLAVATSIVMYDRHVKRMGA